VAVVDGCEAACAAALMHERALDAAIAAVVVLEDDPRTNAGTGSALRPAVDGVLAHESAQMDASVMDAHGFGAVAVVEDLKNPVKLAAVVHGSPHMLLAGAGAMELAARLGLQRADPVTEAQRARFCSRLHSGASDTVGAVVRDAFGAFAVASSTGGTSSAPRGRVGDVPIPGAGLWVGDAGAVAATGIGEVIWREMLAKRCHDEMARGLSAQAAVDACVAFIRDEHPGVDVGLIAVDAASHGGGATGRMPWAVKRGAPTTA
jgi:L-asparaginase/beta-aspartyl-peptidase (threonine type)